jgi:hypothetical protein
MGVFFYIGNGSGHIENVFVFTSVGCPKSKKKSNRINGADPTQDHKTIIIIIIIIKWQWQKRQ